MTNEDCPDCGLPLASGIHMQDCHVEWAENLRAIPASEIRDRNPFVKLLKKETDASNDPESGTDVTASVTP